MVLANKALTLTVVFMNFMNESEYWIQLSTESKVWKSMHWRSYSAESLSCWGLAGEQDTRRRPQLSSSRSYRSGKPRHNSDDDPLLSWSKGCRVARNKKGQRFTHLWISQKDVSLKRLTYCLDTLWVNMSATKCINWSPGMSSYLYYNKYSMGLKRLFLFLHKKYILRRFRKNYESDFVCTSQ